MLVLVGLVLLVVGAELVVRAGSHLAAKLGVPPILIGLTIVSIGTSTPELAVGIESAINGAGSLAVGNIAGTNIVNLLLILGLSAAMSPLLIAPETRRFDLPIMAVVSFVVLLFAIDLELSRFEGAVLVGIGVAYLIAIVHKARSGRNRVLDIPKQPKARKARSVRSAGDAFLSTLVLVAGLAIIVLGADWLVDGSVEIARHWGISESFIGLTIIAVGTSAPELATAIISTIRGQRDIAIGNLIGSSTFNLTIILGVPVLIAPMVLEAELVRFDIPLMIIATLITGVLVLSRGMLVRLEGALMIGLYGAYLTYLLSTRL
jgi:cation:H+ antiporter